MSATRWRRAWKVDRCHAELLARVHVLDRDVQGLVHHAHGFGAGGGDADVHRVFQRGQAVQRDQRGRRCLERDFGRAAAVLRAVAARRDAAGLALHQEQGDLAVHRGRHQEGVGLVARRHDALGAADASSRRPIRWPAPRRRPAGSAPCVPGAPAPPAPRRRRSCGSQCGLQRLAARSRPARRRRSASGASGSSTMPRPSSSITTMPSTGPMPMPPCSSGMYRPARPSSASSP